MMEEEEISSFYVGNDVKIHIEFVDDQTDVLTDLDADPTLYILQDGYPGEVEITNMVMTKTDTGTYEMWWDSSGQTKGIYIAEVRGKKGGKDVVDKAYLELT